VGEERKKNWRRARRDEPGNGKKRDWGKFWWGSLVFLLFLWFFLFFAFCIKYPLWPLHSWLPEVHVEASTELSCLLAGIILKCGFIGIFKFLYIFLFCYTLWFVGFVDMLCVCGLLFLSFILFFFVDYKKIIACWSLLHTCLSLVLLWHNDVLFVGLCIFCNFAHLISSCLMFIIIGYLYDCYGLRIFIILFTFFGFTLWSYLFLFCVLFNVDFPFTLMFFIDILCLFGILNVSLWYFLSFFVLCLLLFLSSFYCFVCFNFFSFVWCNFYLRFDVFVNFVILLFCLF